MKFVIQRVSEARVESEGEVLGRIGLGFLVLIGIEEGDTEAAADKMIKKLLALRIFQDEAGKTNLSLSDVGGSLLLISQFTLCADCRKGNRPSFIHAAAPEKAEELYEYVIAQCRAKMPEVPVETGSFGADMQVFLINDGPFTILLEDRDL